MRLTILAFVAFSFVGCSTYTIATTDLAKQLQDNQSKKEVFQYLPPPSSLFLDSKYQSNAIEKVVCLNSSGEKVWLYINRNTQLEITSKSAQDVVKMYFDTAFLVDKKIVGLRSRLIQSTVREIALDDIEKIEIYVETPHTEKYVEQ